MVPLLFLRTFGEVHYGFALPSNSPYTTPLSVELLELRNKGEVSRIIDKWMIKKTPCKPLDEAENMGTLFGLIMAHFTNKKTSLLMMLRLSNLGEAKTCARGKTSGENERRLGRGGEVIKGWECILNGYVNKIAEVAAGGYRILCAK